jgi:hypothetical protein
MGLLIAVSCGAGCTTVSAVENIPAEHRKVFRASAYTLSGCQEKLDQLAGQHVEMVEHLDQPLMSALNFGILPPYICRGVLDESAAK